MARILVSPGVPFSVADFNPDEDVLVFALPEDPLGGLKHALSFHHVAAQNYLHVTLTHHASNQQFVIHLPGVLRIRPNSIAVLSLSEADNLPGFVRPEDSATLTGEGVYPARDETVPGPAPGQTPARFHHDHDWRRLGPPPERFFDLSNSEGELDIILGPDTGGPIYAIRLTESAPPPTLAMPNQDTILSDSSDTHHSIVLVQTAPDTPPLRNAEIARCFANGLGGPEFRAICWIWLGNEGQYRDSPSGKLVQFGKINRTPQLSIKGPIAGSIAISR